MKLFVANCTNQNQLFMYKLPEVAAARQQPISIGGQIQISGDLTQGQVDSIIEHHSMYGMRRVDELDRVKNSYVPLICSDRPIASNLIERMVFHNNGILTINGKKTREQLALGVDSLMKQREVEENTPGIDKLHIHVEEDDKKGHDGELNEIITVDRNNPQPAKARKSKAIF